jgi:hypothetical protein
MITTDTMILIFSLAGAVAFVRSVSIEAVGLGVHLAAGAHDMLVKTEHALTAVPPSLASCEAKRTKDNVRANQPESAQQGMKQVLNSSPLHGNLNLQQVLSFFFFSIEMLCFTFA